MPAAPPPPPRRAARASRSTSSAMNRLLIGAVATLVIVAVAVAGWTFGNTWRDYDTTTTGQDQQQQQAGVETEEPQVLSPDSANGFDPAGDGEEHNDKAGLAIDGDTSTSWNTQGYNSALFGNLKDGVGLIIDMGDTVQLAEMDLVLGDGGTSLEIRVGDEASLESLTTVHTETGASGDTAITLDEPAEGRYILVWFTELPPDGSRYRAMVHNVELRGNM